MIAILVVSAISVTSTGVCVWLMHKVHKAVKANQESKASMDLLFDDYLLKFKQTASQNLIDFVDAAKHHAEDSKIQAARSQECMANAEIAWRQSESSLKDTLNLTAAAQHSLAKIDEARLACQSNATSAELSAKNAELSAKNADSSARASQSSAKTSEAHDESSKRHARISQTLKDSSQRDSEASLMHAENSKRCAGLAQMFSEACLKSRRTAHHSDDRSEDQQDAPDLQREEAGSSALRIPLLPMVKKI